MSVRRYSYEAHVVGVVSNPVAEVTNKILNLERKIKNFERRTRHVEKLKVDLQGSDLFIWQMGKIQSLRYIEHESIEAVMQELAIFLEADEGAFTYIAEIFRAGGVIQK